VAYPGGGRLLLFAWTCVPSLTLAKSCKANTKMILPCICVLRNSPSLQDDVMLFSDWRFLASLTNNGIIGSASCDARGE